MLLKQNLRACRLCAERFEHTKTAHSPRPIIWFQSTARLLIAGQAPGWRVQQSGKPFTDPSGDRLRDWLGLECEDFYDKNRVAIVPMSFCFPGYDAKGSDLPPPRTCSQTWHDRVMAELASIKLRIVVGAHAQRYHLGTRHGVTATVANWRARAPAVYALPHPSWRNTAWLKRNPWFETELLPHLRARVKEIME